MKRQLPFLLFCEDPLDRSKVDPDFKAEFVSARGHGFQTILYNYDALADNNGNEFSINRIKVAYDLTDVIYRGWMLTPSRYAILYQELLQKNFRLINTATEYQNCHYLPDSLRFIEAKTPLTIFEKLSSDDGIGSLVKRAEIFGDKPVIIKDFVKSEKYDWDTACFVPDASDTKKLEQSIIKLIQLRGKYLNEGIVVREFVELADLTVHSKSGMPLKEEYRLFFFEKKLIGIYNYWDEGEYLSSKPNTAEFEWLAQVVENNFFTMDIARKKDGEFIIIELGDGQVSGLPENVDTNEFYKNLASICLEIG
jgi:hypothetical protein